MKFIIFFPLVVVLTVFSPFVFYLSSFLPQRWQAQIMITIIKLWCKSIFFSFGTQLQHCKKQPTSSIKKPLLIISNHQSYMDIVFIIYLFQCGFILKSSLMRTPFGWNAKFFGSIALHRANLFSLKKARQKCAKRLKQNISLCLFPEGTRGDGEKLLPFKRGLLDFYYQNKTATLVLAQYGNHFILPKNKLLPAFGKKSVIYDCGIIEPKNYTNLKLFIEACRQKMATGLVEAKKIYNEE